MQVLIHLPHDRREAPGGARIVVAAETAGGALRAAAAQHPALESVLFDRNGALRPALRVFLHGEDVRYLQGLDTSLQDGDELTLVGLMQHHEQ